MLYQSKRLSRKRRNGRARPPYRFFGDEFLCRRRESEQHLLGVERQEVIGDRIQIALRGMPTRPITVRTWRASDGRCTSSAEMTIAGVPARLAGVYVRQTLFGVDYVVFTGWSEEGAVVRERVSP